MFTAESLGRFHCFWSLFTFFTKNVIFYHFLTFFPAIFVLFLSTYGLFEPKSIISVKNRDFQIADFDPIFHFRTLLVFQASILIFHAFLYLITVFTKRFKGAGGYKGPQKALFGYLTRVLDPILAKFPQIEDWEALLEL